MSEEVCKWQLHNSHGLSWSTECGAYYDANDFGCSEIVKCPKCGKKTSGDSGDKLDEISPELMTTEERDVKNEKDVFASIVAAWNSFVKLSCQHPDDQDEFRHSAHNLQRLIGIRELRRLHPDKWYNQNNKEHLR